MIAPTEVNVTVRKVNVTSASSTFSGNVDIGGNMIVVGRVGGASGKFAGVTVETHDHIDDNTTRITKVPNKQ